MTVLAPTLERTTTAAEGLPRRRFTVAELVPRLPPDPMLVTETTFRLTPDTYREPEFALYPEASGIRGLNAATARLVVELADSSLGYDLGRKAALYANFGIAELLVIDAVRLAADIHLDPHPQGYGSVEHFTPADTLSPQIGAGLAVTLSQLELH